MTILRYHGFSNWRISKVEEDNLDKDFTFGFELEVTLNHCEGEYTPSDLANEIDRRYHGLFVCERDGSIGNGVEIISQPMTWRWFIANVDTFKSLLKLCVDYGFDSHKGDKCGLHVHVGRQALHGVDDFGNRLNEQNVISNINFIMERFQNEMFKFSRRTSNSYRWTKSRTSLIQLENSCSFIDKDRIRRISNGDDDRYHSVNLTNRNTVEIRLLRGTLKWETFFISMNLIKNIIENSRISNHSVSFKTLVLNGLDENMCQYAHEFCELRNIDLDSSECNTIIFLERTCVKEANNMFQINKIELASLLDE